MIKIFIISPLFLVCTVNYRSSFSSLIKPEYELYPQLIRCASFTAWHGEHCHGCPRAKNTLNSSLSCEQACLTYCLPEATSCSSLSMIWLKDDFLGPLPIHLFTDTAVKSETALKALFWAPTWVPWFEYVTWLACLKWGGGLTQNKDIGAASEIKLCLRHRLPSFKFCINLCVVKEEATTKKIFH